MSDSIACPLRREPKPLHISIPAPRSRLENLGQGLAATVVQRGRHYQNSVSLRRNVCDRKFFATSKTRDSCKIMLILLRAHHPPPLGSRNPAGKRGHLHRRRTGSGKAFGRMKKNSGKWFDGGGSRMIEGGPCKRHITTAVDCVDASGFVFYWNNDRFV